jgi:hypothetical protein
VAALNVLRGPQKQSIRARASGNKVARWGEQVSSPLAPPFAPHPHPPTTTIAYPHIGDHPSVNCTLGCAKPSSSGGAATALNLGLPASTFGRRISKRAIARRHLISPRVRDGNAIPGRGRDPVGKEPESCNRCREFAWAQVGDR